MKRIIITLTVTLTVGLILWGLVKSPQLSSAGHTVAQKVTEKLSQIKNVTHIFQEKTPEPLPANIAAEKAKLDSLMGDLDAIKATYEEQLAAYKALDKAYTDLIMKSRKNPNRELIKSKQAELDAEFENLSEVLKTYQAKSQELYKFQNENLKGV